MNNLLCLKDHMKQNRLTAIFLVWIALFNTLGCSGSQRAIETSSLQQDATVIGPIEVPLLGLPVHEDAGASSDASFLEAGTTPMFGAAHNGELVVPLHQDASAPFNGVLFNGPAVARISVEFASQQRLCLIERNHDVGLVVARYDADVASLQLAIDTQRRTDNVLLSGRAQDVARLNRLLQTQVAASSGPHIGEGLIWAGGGLLAGVLVVGGIVIFANSRP